MRVLCRGLPLLEYGGLKPILPFSEGRSDAARRIVIWPSCLPPMEIYGHYHGTGREGTRGWAGESSRCEDPAPTVGRWRGCHCDPHRDPGTINRNAAALIATRHAALVREGTRYARHLPYQEPY